MTDQQEDQPTFREQYVVWFNVQEHHQEEQETVWIDRQEDWPDLRAKGEAVIEAAEQSPYTHEETRKIEKVQEIA